MNLTEKKMLKKRSIYYGNFFSFMMGIFMNQYIYIIDGKDADVKLLKEPNFILQIKRGIHQLCLEEMKEICHQKY